MGKMAKRAYKTMGRQSGQGPFAGLRLQDHPSKRYTGLDVVSDPASRSAEEEMPGQRRRPRGPRRGRRLGTQVRTPLAP